ncbi:MAG: protocatechuate 4,5-dioxygenase subunit alpha [Actinomycetota bacterium]
MAVDKPYTDIPGTTIFDTEQAAKGYWLNQFAMSLSSAANRERFLADEDAYLDEWKMTEDQKQGVRDRDLNQLIELGGNIYYLAKIRAAEGWTYAAIVASMTEHTAEEHTAMMFAGGRSIEGNRYTHEQGGTEPADAIDGDV